VGKFKDYYDVLGIQPRSHHRVIEEKYWEQAHELHREPTKKASRRLVLINEAYETLGTPHKRAAYDMKRRDALEPMRPAPRATFLQSFVSLLGKPFRPD
jgi:curved DNA-binding protein CbpA